MAETERVAQVSAVWQRPTWKILSLLLSYPGEDTYSEVLSSAAEWAEELADEHLSELLAAFRRTDVDELISEYVGFFDFQADTCLYLTAHELGDSRKRGVALVALRRMLASAGWEQSESELPDYLPLLFEFLGAQSAEFPTHDLEVRLGRVCEVLRNKLPEASLYHRLFSFALEMLPSVPIPDNGIVFSGREGTDLEELPYPLFYE